MVAASRKALIYSHACIRQQGRLRPYLEKLLILLSLYKSKGTKALLSHPFGAWLLLFPDVVAALAKGVTIACERRRARKQNQPSAAARTNQRFPKQKSYMLLFRLLTLSMAIAYACTAEAGAKLAELGIANQHLARALVNLEKQSNICDAAVQVIPKSAFDGLDVPAEHLQAAFLYFFVKASNECLKEATGEYLIAIALYEHFADGVTSPSGESVDMNFLVMMNVIREIEREKEYLALPRSSREKLESIKEFSKPFDPFLSAENAGLIRSQPPESQHQ